MVCAFALIKTNKRITGRIYFMVIRSGIITTAKTQISYLGSLRRLEKQTNPYLSFYY